MTQKSYFSLSAAIFAVVAVVHLLRIINGWHMQVGNFIAPLWISYVGIVLAGFLAYKGFKFSGKK